MLLWMPPPSRFSLTVRSLLLNPIPRRIAPHRCCSTANPTASHSSAPRFYAHNLALQTADTGTLVQLPQDEGRHATRVLRLQDVRPCTSVCVHTGQLAPSTG